LSLVNDHINYVDFKTNDLAKTKLFYTARFSWVFTDYGPNYIAFSESGLEGRFEKTEGPIINGALIVLYHSNLIEVKHSIIDAGGEISKDIFPFPGGQRFQFKDPSGNELAVWSEQ
jgi:predicted enzyme related to lactoylglutathione lyase